MEAWMVRLTSCASTEFFGGNLTDGRDVRARPNATCVGMLRPWTRASSSLKVTRDDPRARAVVDGGDSLLQPRVRAAVDGGDGSLPRMPGIQYKFIFLNRTGNLEHAGVNVQALFWVMKPVPHMKDAYRSPPPEASTPQHTRPDIPSIPR